MVRLRWAAVAALTLAMVLPPAFATAAPGGARAAHLTMTTTPRHPDGFTDIGTPRYNPSRRAGLCLHFDIDR